MKLLVTGGSGLLGSKFCELAIKRNHEVYSAYCLHKPLLGEPVELDITNASDVELKFSQIKPEAVVHAGALTDVDKCELEKDLAWKTNVEGTKNISDSCLRNRVFLVYISTDYVFSGEKGMYTESDRPSPANYYGFTKLKGEEAAKAVVDNSCIARSSVIYGTAPATGKINFALWLLDKLRKKEKVSIVTDQWNSPTLNVSLANLVLEALERKLTGVFHMAGATRISRYEFATCIAETFSLDASLITPVLSKDIKWVAKRPRDSSLNVDKATRTLNNQPLQIRDALYLLKKEME